MRTELPSDTATPSPTNVCAVVIAYFPDKDFEARLQTVLPQVARLVVVDNTPEAYSLSPEIFAAWGTRLHYIANHTNRGVAAALNQGIEYAHQQECPWLLTLDQDTRCYSNMVTTLGDVYRDCYPKPAVIGSNYFDPLNNRFKEKVDGLKLWLEQKTVITSGCIVNVDVGRRLLGFREDYFIDQLDHEFCLRVRSHGYLVVMSRRPTMAHSVGISGGARLPFLGLLPNHPPIRKYYIARNTLMTVAIYWQREPGWCLRRLVRLFLGLMEMALLEEHRFLKIRAFAGGVIDALRHRMGPCQKEWLYEKNQR